jgi:hypothetical protein
MTRYGTAYFVTRAAAAEYYGSAEEAKRKLAAGEVHIGRPETKPGQRSRLDESEGRYFIEELDHAHI